jgi:hypothetical protein
MFMMHLVMDALGFLVSLMMSPSLTFDFLMGVLWNYFDGDVMQEGDAGVYKDVFFGMQKDMDFEC